MTIEALQAKRARREKTGGDCPFGYRAVPTGRLTKQERPLLALVEDPEEQAVIQRIRDLQADGWSLRRISGKLQELGIPGRRGACTWSPVTLCRIMARERRMIGKQNTG
jgi:hypothetical protein